MLVYTTVEPLYKEHAGTIFIQTEVSFIQRLNYTLKQIKTSVLYREVSFIRGSTVQVKLISNKAQKDDLSNRGDMHSLGTEDVVMETPLTTLALGPQLRKPLLEIHKVSHLSLVDGGL